MKKSILTLAAGILATAATYAQTTTADTAAVQSLKPTGGSIATELNVNPFNGTLSLNNSLNQLKFRYFTHGNHAFRLGITGNSSGHMYEISNPYGTNPTNFKDDRNTTTLGLSLGVEKHFTGTRRLSPYVGGDLMLVNKSTKQVVTQGQYASTTTGAWVNYTYPSGNPNYPVIQHDERAFIRIGINLVTGFDFYMARNFFFGYELNFGYNYTDHKQVETKNTSSGTSSGSGSGSNNNIPTVTSTSSSFGPNLMNGIRIGYVF